jgi:hypothetical protein
MRDDRDDPNRMIPIGRHPERLEIGVRSVNGVYGRAKTDRDFPPIWKIHCKNYVMLSELIVYREKLEQRKLAKLAAVSPRKRRENHDP